MGQRVGGVSECPEQVRGEKGPGVRAWGRGQGSGGGRSLAWSQVWPGGG